MAKKAKRKSSRWAIKEEFGSVTSSRGLERRRSWGGVGFGIFLLLIAVIWMGIEFGWIPSLPFWPVALALFSLFIIISSLAKR